MAWSADAARPLAEAFDGAPGTPGTVIAVACIDDGETVIQVNPGETPADGRFEVGSVTKTMTATLPGRFPGQLLAVRPRGHGRHHDHVRQRHARPADRLRPVGPGLRHEPASAATL